MRKISIETTIVEAGRFFCRNVVSIVGTMWLPVVLLIAIGGGLAWLTLPPEWFDGSILGRDEAFYETYFSSPETWNLLMPGAAALVLFIFASFVVTAMIMARLMRHALGLKKNTTWIYLSLGAPVWRMIGAFLLYYLAILVLYVAIMLIACLADVGLTQIPDIGARTAVSIVALLIAIMLLFLLFAAIKMAFFLPAAVVAEKRMSPLRSWRLSKGNFWRIVAVLLIVYIPVGIVVCIAMQLAVVPAILPAALQMPAEPSPEQAFGLFRDMLPDLPALLAIVAVAKIVIVGLVTGAMGSAYNQLIGETNAPQA